MTAPVATPTDIGPFSGREGEPVPEAALSCNAGAVILTHNHPSGVAEPSSADRYMTDSLRAALGMVDVRVLDHIIVAGGRSVSLAERGLV